MGNSSVLVMIFQNLLHLVLIYNFLRLVLTQFKFKKCTVLLWLAHIVQSYNAQSLVTSTTDSSITALPVPTFDFSHPVVFLTVSKPPPFATDLHVYYNK